MKIKMNKNNKGFFALVYEQVKKIPRGKVATYGQIAMMCNSPRASRAVGWALHVNPYPGEIPCHRVVNKKGCLAPAFAFGGSDAQRKLLLAEGVQFFSDDMVDLSKCQFGEFFAEDLKLQ